MKPRALKPGDTIGLVSPASPLTADKLDFTINLLESKGYRARVAPHALSQDGHLAGTDHQRAADLQEFFADPEIHGILCTRGGYGCARILHLLDLDAVAASRKLFIGFSDITTLHLALNRRGLPTLHGPMALTLHYEREPWVYDSFLRSLAGDLTISEQAPSAKTMVEGVAEGITTGGCLCLLTDSIATPDALDVAGKILFIEDVDEAPHRIDAMFTHLLNANILQQAAGLVIGEMTRTDDRLDPAIGGKGWKQIVEERVLPLNIPTVVDFPFGHAKGMLTVGLGIRARLDATKCELTYLEPLCQS